MQTKLNYQNLKTPKIQPRGGRTTIDGQLKLWSALRDSGADLLPLTIDSKTRLGQIAEATDAYKKSLKSGVETLNGFPLLSVPPAQAKEMLEQAHLPVSLRHGTPLPFNLVKRALEVGVREIEGGPISYSLPYSRDSDLKQVIKSWMKVETLCGKQEQTIVRENFGILTACLVHPLQAIITNVLECAFIHELAGGLPMASFGATGHRLQDLASVQAFKKTFAWYLDLRNLEEINPLVAFHHWMGPFPMDELNSRKIILDGTSIALQIKADKVVTKTTVESKGVPTIESNSEAVRLVADFLLRGHLNHGHLAVSLEDLNEESEILFEEAKFQLKALLKESTELPEIILNSVILGFVDPPFAPHQSCVRKFRSLRSANGSIRVCKDYAGRCSEPFVLRENSILREEWKTVSADRIAQDINFPDIDRLSQ